MISKEQLSDWQQQHKKDLEQYKKDQQQLKSQQTPEDIKIRSFFARLRSKFFDFGSEEDEKLQRLLQYIPFTDQLSKYPKVMNMYMTYNTSALLMVGICLIAPKKIISKLISSLIVYGLKLKIGDGMMTYYVVQNMALGDQMTESQQQIRNVMEFYYRRNQFNQKPMTQQQKQHTVYMLEQINLYNQKYQNFKKIESLL